jgi:hypothetical protein
MLFRPKDQRLSLTELTSSPRPYSSAHAPLRSLLVASLRTKRSSFRLFSGPALSGADHAALTAFPHYYRGPDFSPRITQAFRSLPYSLAYPSGSSALRHEHHRREHDEISPGQTPLFLSVPPAHTLSQSTLRKYFLRLKAAGSVKRAHGRPVRLWLAPRLRPGDSTHALRIPSHDGHPALPVTLITGPPVYPASCLRIPLARVRRDFHPQEKRPAGRTALRLNCFLHRLKPANSICCVVQFNLA